jgi:hypothetical protein
MTLLYSSILLSIFGIFLTSLSSFFLSTNFKIYFIVYPLYLFMSIHVIYNFQNYIINNQFKFIIVFSLYFFLFTLPITNYLTESSVVLIATIKYYTPIIIALYFKVKINNELKFFRVMKILVFSGIISSLYSILEVVSLAFSIFPIITQISINYINSGFTKVSVEMLEMLRPTGILFNATHNGFFIGSCFFITLFLGNNIFNKKWATTLTLTILYIGIVLILSRQIIATFHITLFIILFINHSKFIFKSTLFFKKSKKYIWLLLSISSISFIIFSNTDNISFIISEFDPDNTSINTSSILMDDILNLNSAIENIYFRSPFNFVFGFGYTGAIDRHSSTLFLDLWNELHYFFETLVELGIIGFIMYWSFFIFQGVNCWRWYNIGLNDYRLNNNMFLLGTILVLFMVLQNIHYSPLGITNNILIALPIYFGLLPITVKNNRRE